MKVSNDTQFQMLVNRYLMEFQILLASSVPADTMLRSSNNTTISYASTPPHLLPSPAHHEPVFQIAAVNGKLGAIMTATATHTYNSWVARA
jgi:hypothetical protein